MKKNNKIVTVIHVKKYNKVQFEKTLNSLLQQTTKIDILVLDKSNSTKLAKKVEEYNKEHACITYKISYDISIPAIMLEVLNSHYQVGGGVLFLASGQSICRDYCRKLFDVMQTNCADIVVADWVWEKPKGKSCYIPYEEFRNTDFALNYHEILAKYISGHGYNFTWDLLCNKLFSMNLLLKAQNDLQKLLDIPTEHVIGLSFILYSHANKLINCHNTPCYIPFSKEEHSTRFLNEVSLKQYLELFNFLENKLNTLQLGQKVEKDFIIYKNKILSHLQANTKTEVFKKIFGEEEYQTKCVEMSTFTVNFGKEFDKYEKIIEAIISKETKVVSFDIFDTLISRTCLDPKDIFTALGNIFSNELSNAFFVDFKSIRENAENAVRATVSHFEIDIYEIYNYMIEVYGFDKNLADRMLKKEIELELEYSIVRNTGKDLYKIALENHKKVIYTSDMYLPKNIIYKLLEKSGYSLKNSLFLSGEYKASKSQGSLYKKMIAECNVSANAIVHIGDNHWSDVIQAKNQNIQAYHIPNSTEMFYSRLFEPLKQENTSLCDAVGLELFMGTKLMCTIVARKLFDFPFIHQVSTFQCSPRYIGYYALGMHLFALVDWMRNIATNKYDTIHFAARDGYLPLKAYEIFAQYLPNLPKANYLYLSRKFLYPLSIYEKKDLYSSTGQLTWFSHSLNKWLGYFPNTCLNQIEIEKIPLEQRVTNFTSIDTFYKNMNIVDKCIHYDALQEYNTIVKKCFLNVVKQNDIVFDVGYSGRNEAILSQHLGYSIDSFYLHTRIDWATFNFDKSKSKNYTFYDFLPKVTFHIRDILFMSLEFSLKGYNTENNSLEFIQNDINTEEINTIITQLQANALQFVQDFLNNHSTHQSIIAYQRATASLPWDIYLLNAKQIDRMLFANFEFEDDIGLSKLSISYIWGIYTPKKTRFLVSVANKLLPHGSKRRQFVKKVAIKLCPKDSKRYQFAKKLFGK